MFDPQFLTLSGGGVNAIAEVGFIMECLSQGYVRQCRLTSGTSAGAFIALSLALNFNYDDYQNFMETVDFSKFLHSPGGTMGNMNLLFKRQGMYSGKYIREQINLYIKQKTDLDNPSFLELHQKTGRGFLVFATNLSKRIIEPYSYLLTPHVKVATAIQASMAAPPLFEHLKVKKLENGEMVWAKANEEGEIILDGGLIDNFPLHLSEVEFKKMDPQYDKQKHIGLYLVDDEHQKNWIRKNIQPPITQFGDITQYIAELIKTVVINQKQEMLRHLGESDRIVFINTGNNHPFNFSLNQKTKDQLLTFGREAAKKCINKLHAQIQPSCLPHFHTADQPILRSRL